MRPKDTQFAFNFLTLSHFIMSKQVLISLLSKGNNGNEILSILDVITEGNQQSVAYTEPTADPIEF